MKPDEWPLVAVELRIARQKREEAEWSGEDASTHRALVASLEQSLRWGELHVPPF